MWHSCPSLPSISSVHLGLSYLSNGLPWDVHWTSHPQWPGLSHCPVQSTCPMDVHWTGGLDSTVGQAWSVRVGCPMDVPWTSIGQVDRIGQWDKPGHWGWDVLLPSFSFPSFPHLPLPSSIPPPPPSFLPPFFPSPLFSPSSLLSLLHPFSLREESKNNCKFIRKTSASRDGTSKLGRNDTIYFCTTPWYFQPHTYCILQHAN